LPRLQISEPARRRGVVRTSRYNLSAVKSEYFPSGGRDLGRVHQEYTDENSLLDQAYSSASATAVNCSFQNDVIRA
jgi:hypothetical protein